MLDQGGDEGGDEEEDAEDIGPQDATEFNMFSWTPTSCRISSLDHLSSSSRSCRRSTGVRITAIKYWKAPSPSWK